MRLTMAIATAALLLGAATARAEVSGQEDRFMKGLRETVYATDQHLVFSVRTSLIHWLGGAVIADEADLAAARREGWWGTAVPVVPGGVDTPRNGTIRPGAR